MENSTPTLKLPRRMAITVVLFGLVGFLSGVLVGLLPCQYCEKPVLQMGKYKVFGEHRIYCPLGDR